MTTDSALTHTQQVALAPKEANGALSLGLFVQNLPLLSRIDGSFETAKARATSRRVAFGSESHSPIGRIARGNSAKRFSMSSELISIADVTEADMSVLHR